MANKDKPAKVKKNINLKAKTTGVLQLFVVCSIGYMAFVIWSGLDDPISKALTAPALIWAGLVLVNRFGDYTLRASTEGLK